MEILKLEHPHGFLVAQGKQTAIARVDELDADKKYLIASGDEVFGIAELDQPAQLSVKAFDSQNWQKQHRVNRRERRQWWKDQEIFYVYPIIEWTGYDDVKILEDGKVIDEPELTDKQKSIVSQSMELPKQIPLIDEAIAITDDNKFFVASGISDLAIKDILEATYDNDPEFVDNAINAIPLYSLSLVRNPRMRVSKKNLVTESDIKIQEGKKMPFAIVTRGDEFCVVNTETEKVMGCHSTEDEADDQLSALNTNVEEGESRFNKPKKKPKKDKGFLDGLRELYKNIANFLAQAENDVNSPELFSNDFGIAQKEVNGELWHFAWSTNAFEDREGEIFSTSSLEKYVAENEANKDKGYFNLFHINESDGNFNTDFAKKEWQGVVGRFLIEAGPYLDDQKGQSAKAFFAKFPNGHPELAPEGWGCSPEYKYLPEERVTGVYKNIWITRTSVLPRMDAANIWTEAGQLERSKNMALTEKQMEMAISVFGGKENVDSLIAMAEQKTTELEKAGVAHKSNDEPEVETKPAEVSLDEKQFEILAQEIAKQFNVSASPLVEAIEGMSKELEEAVKRIIALEKTTDAKQKAEVPKFTFSLQRASESENTIVSEDDKVKDQMPAETKVDPRNMTPMEFFRKS